ncbi:hypothetical protein ACJIZ3_004095 [Penstemon smallii]|uniref:Auxin-responsive protein SAUR36-like n=1 Tax=Penstemon smallii TaxID=265156 RepID=A0ABD3S131_9LAMI
MDKIKGFRLGRRFFKWCINRRRPTSSYHRLQTPISVFRKWVHSLKSGAKGLCSAKGNSGYIRVGQEPVVEELKLPKGHLAVYVGDKEDDTSRVLVPVMYFNHPLFGQLLSEAEKVYGFNHSGGIQIPCPKSELENIQMKIAAVSGDGSRRRKWS